MLTLAFAFRDDEILLGMKKKGLGVGRWNGFGGKVEESESIENAAIREFAEEAHIQVSNLRKCGVLDFSFENDPKVLEVHIFKTINFVGKPEESDEMIPKWFSIDAIPFEQMWSDDPLWFPYMLAGKRFKGYFRFDRPSDATYSAKILEHKIVEVGHK